MDTKTMPDTITLTKVSDSKIKKSPDNVAVYESDNGLTVIFMYDDTGCVDNTAVIRNTIKTIT